MIFEPAPLAGAYVLEVERLEDERGFFARTYCIDELAARGLEACALQCSISFNAARGTLRGMHYQVEPKAEAKLVRCTRGAIYDVIIDLRPAAPTYRRWFAAELTAENRRSLYVPRGFAHGFQTLEAGSEVLYQMSALHSPDHARGVRWNDPAFAIDWPLEVATISPRDAGYPDFAP